jgi:dTDP-4-dehydrorhamnose 3,5-epimerase
MFHLSPSSISGCYELTPALIEDDRGRFVKVFQREVFLNLGLETEFTEEYYTTSHRNVIRGMHFQAPPDDHVKVVYCVHGNVFDVVLDLRKKSESYGQISAFTLSAKQGNYLYIPKGVAHGFCVTSDSATLVYKVSSSYSPKNDCGIDCLSIGVEWPTSAPILSDRDQKFTAFANFNSPF